MGYKYDILMMQVKKRSCCACHVSHSVLVMTFLLFYKDVPSLSVLHSYNVYQICIHVTFGIELRHILQQIEK